VTGCHGPHWFAYPGEVGSSSPECTRYGCEAENPRYRRDDDTHYDPDRIPQAWRQLGFSGLFKLDVPLDPDVDPDEFAAKLPDRVPFHSNSGWLALRVLPDPDEEGRRLVRLVRRDSNAIVEAFTTPRAVGS
jgi:hypothetical protein